MEQTNNTFTKSTMTSGAILGSGMIIFSFILYIAGLNEGTSLNMLSYVILIGGIMYGIKQVRDKIQNGFISYGRAVGSGTLVALFASIILAFYMFILMKYVDNSMIAKSIELTQQKWSEGGMTDDQVESMTKMVEPFITPGFMAFGTVFSITFVGVIISLIVAAFMKKEPNIFANNTSSLDSTI
ncbi:MAG TPA: DUF4199 domain-containing protein [Bacteroidales bacterium]|nr:DUF4199 domain-containing protein [Bacteroidales bacterium]